MSESSNFTQDTEQESNLVLDDILSIVDGEKTDLGNGMGVTFEGAALEQKQEQPKQEEPVQPKPVQPTKEVSEQQKTQEQDDLLANLFNETVELPPPAEKTEVPDNVWIEKETGYKSRIQELETQLSTLKELQENPLKFVMENVPGLVAESFNPTSYIESKLKEKYGEFEPDMSQAHKLGTPHYEYFKDMRQLEQEAGQLKDNATNQQALTAEQEEQRIYGIKQLAAKRHGLDEQTYDQQVWSILSQANEAQIVALATDGLLAQKRLRETRTNAQKNIKHTIPSVVESTAPTTNIPDKELAVIEDMFGKRGGSSYSII